MPWSNVGETLLVMQPSSEAPLKNTLASSQTMRQNLKRVIPERLLRMYRNQGRITAFWDATPCSLARSDQCIGVRCHWGFRSADFYTALVGSWPTFRNSLSVQSPRVKQATKN